MKKKLSLILALFMVLMTVFTGCGPASKKTVLNVYNWGDYIDESLISDFEKEYDVKVNYETFPTNEDMIVKIKSGGTAYDVAIPSDYMIQRMINEDLLVKVDKTKLKNYKNIADQFKNLAFDSNNEYSVPYLWGTLGILYNSKEIKEPITGWDALWNHKYKGNILMLDSQRDAIAIALKKLGYPLNSTDANQLEEAKKELMKQKPLVMSYVLDDGKNMLIGGEANIGVVWSGDAFWSMKQNEDLKYVIPKEGTNIWVDSMVIPKSSKNVELAHKFIDFMLRPESSKRNAEYIEYAIPNEKGKALLDDSVKNNKVAYPNVEELKNSEVFTDLPKETLKKYDEVWTEVKAQ